RRQALQFQTGVSTPCPKRTTLLLNEPEMFRRAGRFLLSVPPVAGRLPFPVPSPPTLWSRYLAVSGEIQERRRFYREETSLARLFTCREGRLDSGAACVCVPPLLRVSLESSQFSRRRCAALCRGQTTAASPHVLSGHRLYPDR